MKIILLVSGLVTISLAGLSTILFLNGNSIAGILMFILASLSLTTVKTKDD